MILKHKPGPASTAKQVETPLQSFNLFFTDEMLEKIVTYTNNSMEPAMGRFSNLLKESDKYPHFWKVDKIDILYLETRNLTWDLQCNNAIQLVSIHQ